ncbi:MAG: hypothetical protein J7K36_05695 [Archaeoglobaceae archaeon]|nr:hypothetical protein [Archaeoglobaceae archaeon]HDD36413.1 hypothetical protein [Archaeoglobus veneficus]
MSKVVYIMPVNPEKEILLESIKKIDHPIQKVYLLLGKDDNESQKAAEEIEKTLNVLIEVEKTYIDENDVYSAVLEILKIVKREISEGNEVIVNATGSTKTVCIACYIASQLSRSKFYMMMQKVENGKVVNEIVELLIPPLKKIGEDKVTIIKIISEEGGEVESINKLIELLEGKTKDQKEYMAQRARMSYHLKGLEEDGLVVMQREGKNVKIKLTELGKAYALMYQ